MKQLFFSHTWQHDNLGRNNHNRVKILVKEMQKLGWTTWFDEDDMIGNIDASMAFGIDTCRCIIVCITEAYCRKINESAQNPRKRDNCFKEWNYAHHRNKLMIPIIMEPSMLNINKWPYGVVPLHLSSILYINCSGNYYYNSGITTFKQLISNTNNLITSVKKLHLMLLNYNLKPRFIYKPLSNIPNLLRRKSKSCSNLVGIIV